MAGCVDWKGEAHPMWTAREPGYKLLKARLLVLCALVLIAAPGFPSPAAAVDDLEAKVKTAYVYNFMAFIEWEAESKEPSAPMRICVLGDDPSLELLRELCKRQIRGRAIEVKAARRLEALLPCHVMLFSQSERARTPEVLKALQGMSILTVSDIPDFAKSGGMVGFVTEEGRVKIEVNPRLVTQSGLRISAKLLEVARIIP